MAYQLELSPELSIVHKVFHMSQLRKYAQDPSHVIEPDPVQLQDDLSYEEQLIKFWIGWRNNFVERRCLW